MLVHQRVINLHQALRAAKKLEAEEGRDDPSVMRSLWRATVTTFLKNHSMVIFRQF